MGGKLAYINLLVLNKLIRTNNEYCVISCIDVQIITFVEAESAVKTCLHGCKRETAALTTVSYCITPFAASRVRFASLQKAADCP